MFYKRCMTADGLPPPRPDIFGDMKIANEFLIWTPSRSAQLLEPGRLARAAWAFPLGGLVVGLLGAYSYVVASLAGLPVVACALLALAALVLLTGGLHADGLADMADGLGGNSRERRLEIMRDSRIGAYGVMALVFVIGLDAAALVSIEGADAGPYAVMAVLTAAATASRAAMVLVMKLLPPARDDGLGAWAGQPSWTGVIIAAVYALLVVLVGLATYPWWVTVVTSAAGLLAVAAVMAIAARAFGGYTGDVLGAVQQVSETAMLLAASAALTLHAAS